MTGGLALSSELGSLVQQAKSSGTYALMNKMGGKDGIGLKDKLDNILGPIRNNLNI